MLHPRCLSWLLLLMASMGSHATTSAQETEVIAPVESATDDQVEALQFSFDRTPWRDVIQWLASQADLALHVSDSPTGTFTYSDPNSFTTAEAIDRINLFLLPQGFTLVRSGRLLSVINLSDARSVQQLETLARMVPVEELNQLDSHDVVKCIFPLGEISAEDAVEELAPLKLMSTPRVFSKTNRIMVIDTVSKLNSVKAILEAFEPSTLATDTSMKNFDLQHVDAEDILVVARPHLGLATGEMIGIDVSLSADPEGKNIFVTGVEDKVTLIEELIKALDKPQESVSATDGESVLQSYIVKGGNVDTVYDVLQTLLAGKTVRMSMDKTAGSIVALASPAVQQEIAQTVKQLEADEADFEVIPLKSVDPYFAISLIEGMLDLPDPLLDDDEALEDAPRIDADPGNMRLFVHGKSRQIERIKKIIAGLDDSAGVGDGEDEIRLFPIKGKRAEEILLTASKFWREENPIFLYGSANDAQREQTERVVVEDQLEEKQTNGLSTGSFTKTSELLTGNPTSRAPAIRCQMTSRGLLMQSEDLEALDKFYEHLQTIAGPVDATPSPPIVFYLKYTKSDDAIRMLAELLDGGETASEGEAGTLVNGYVSAGSSGYFGSLVTTREGTLTMTAGTTTIVSDSRLNRLIAQGTASDIETIEDYLRIIDKDDSITSVEVYGTSHVIELVHTKASEVAATVREAYADRVAAPTTAARTSTAAAQKQAQRDAAAAAKAAKAQGSEQQDAGKKAPERGPSNQTARNLEPRMTIAVHEPSNSLIITAPDRLFREVEQLVKLIDSRNEQAVEVIRLKEAPVEMLIRQLITGEGGANSSRSRTSSQVPRTAQPSSRSNRGR